MPLGILEPKEMRDVPGTCLLSDDPNQRALELYKDVDVSTLKHGSGNCASILVLVYLLITSIFQP